MSDGDIEIDPRAMALVVGGVLLHGGVWALVGHYRLGDPLALVGVSVFLGLLAAQCVALVLLRGTRLPNASIAVCAVVLGAGFGVWGPVAINAVGDSTAARSGPIEVVQRRCDRAGYLQVRPLAPRAGSRWIHVGVRTCYAQSRGRVISYVEGRGRLGATWRAGFERRNERGPIVLDDLGWKANQAGNWAACIDLTSQALAYEPEEQVARMLTARAFCRSKVGETAAARQDYIDSCEAGYQKTCQWLDANPDWGLQ